MLAYNLNCWLMLFNREPQADATQLRHTTLATSRLRRIAPRAQSYAPVMLPALRRSDTAGPSIAVHRNSCTACKPNGTRNFGARLGWIGLSGG